MDIQLTINSSPIQLDIDPQRTLLSVLRDDLDLTGSKYGCGDGKCGACTVLLDGQAATIVQHHGRRDRRPPHHDHRGSRR